MTDESPKVFNYSCFSPKVEKFLDSKIISSKTNSQSSHTEASSSAMESNLPEVSNVNRALAINATASQSALTTKSKLKHVPKQQLRPSPFAEAPSFSVDN